MRNFNKTSWWAGPRKLTRLTLIVAAVTVAALALLPRLDAQTAFFVYEMTNPCHDTRQDWFSVATQNPAQPGSFQSFRQVAGPFPTFVSAMADADARKMNVNGFRRACCADWSVIKNQQTGALAAFRTSQVGGIPFGWLTVDSRPQCCEDAFAEAGIGVGKVRDCRNLQLGAPMATASGVLPAGSTITLTATGVWVPFGATPVPRPDPCAGSSGPLSGSSLTGTTLSYYPRPTPASCQSDCAGNPSCQGYNWIAPGTYQPGDPAMCYLLSAVTGSNPTGGHIAVSKCGGRFPQPPPDPIAGGTPPGPPRPPGPPQPPPTPPGQRSCTAEERATFAKMTGSFRGHLVHVSIGGSCEQATGTYKVADWCDPVDAAWVPENAKVSGTFTGRMEGGSLQVNYQQPSSKAVPGGRKGTGSCSLSSGGTRRCSFACNEYLQ